MELDQIMKGNYAHFMLKEIHEQTESLTNTMRGRVKFDTGEIILGGIVNHLHEIRRCRRIVFIACGTSFNSAVAVCFLLVSVNGNGSLDRLAPLLKNCQNCRLA